MRAISSDVRFTVDPADVPPAKAARRLHLALAKFEAVLPRLLARGFPPADPDTGMYDLHAIDEWRRRRHGSLYGLPSNVDPVATPAAESEAAPVESLGAKFSAAAKRSRHGAAS